jgi:hypothetical protein
LAGILSCILMFVIIYAVSNAFTGKKKGKTDDQDVDKNHDLKLK